MNKDILEEVLENLVYRYFQNNYYLKTLYQKSFHNSNVNFL